MNPDYETLKAQNERANEYNRQLLERNSKLRLKYKKAIWTIVYLAITIALILALTT